MKVLLDTNIILDSAIERQPFVYESDRIFLLIEQQKFEGYVSASTFGDLYYLIRKAKGRDLALYFLINLANLCRIANVNEAAISIALTANFRDFEDAIQYSTAVINQLDAIVTRNPQDFTNVSLRILTPTQLIQELEILP
ncbi:PIN domain-containing protein [Argonema antarcticum]|uniref:PIN domain-containing protein n=1 Tax=Argonema antarcticum TaxID=2942763 RepID=UPI002011EE30|nr:PIN domain-containing protein [Argonema antarcticum A004/B2]